MLGTALWLAVLGAAGAVVLMCALVAFMFGPLYYAEYRVGKDIHKRYRAAGPEQSWYSLSGGPRRNRAGELTEHTTIQRRNSRGAGR